MENLSNHTTFRVGGPANNFVRASNESEIIAAIEAAGDQPILILGSGSNVLISDTGFPGTVIQIANNKVAAEVDACSGATLSIGAGENWDDFVKTTIDRGWAGLETLSGIPGTVGAALIQNIGAYGVEVAQYIDHITAYDVTHSQFAKLTNSQCQFAYRDSIFKQHPKQFIITQVSFKLPKQWQARLHYADLATLAPETTQAKDIFDAVCNIRSNKLPNPAMIGNAGSFFQNPLVSNEQYQSLLKEFPNLVSYPDAGNKRKLAAGWLIDQCGLKGQRMGNVGVYENQALVLVNHGGGTAQDILGLAKCIQDAVHSKFGVKLEIEPNIF